MARFAKGDRIRVLQNCQSAEMRPYGLGGTIVQEPFALREVSERGVGAAIEQRYEVLFDERPRETLVVPDIVLESCLERA